LPARCVTGKDWTGAISFQSGSDAVKDVQRGIAEIDERNGRISGGQVSASDGLAGFTATLIDAVTRLTAYVNEVFG